MGREMAAAEREHEANDIAGGEPFPTTHHSTTHHSPLLHYRPWRGEFRSSWASIWPIARVSLRMIFRRKLFWALYSLGLFLSFIFFFCSYLVSCAAIPAA